MVVEFYPCHLLPSGIELLDFDVAYKLLHCVRHCMSPRKCDSPEPILYRALGRTLNPTTELVQLFFSSLLLLSS